MDAVESRELTAHLVLTPDLATRLQRETTQRDLIEAFRIVGPVEEQRVMATQCNGELRATKLRLAWLKEQKGKFVQPAKAIIAQAEAFFDPALEANQALEVHLKAELTRFTNEEAQREEAARREQERVEREARMKAESEAAAARARADQEARQRKREEMEAEDRRVKAEKEGNERAAREAAAQAAKAREAGQHAIEKGEEKAQAAELAAGAVPTTQEPAPAPQKLAGFSTRENWVAECEPGVDVDGALRKVVAAIAGVEPAQFVRVDLLSLLELSMPAANKLAKALKKGMNVPGLRAVNKPVAASRAS